MFNDSLTALMFMQVLCFVGMLVMFLFIIRSLSSQTAALREQSRQHQAGVADMERQLMDMAFQLRRINMSGPDGERPGTLAPVADLRALLDSVNEQSAPRIGEQVNGLSGAPTGSSSRTQSGVSSASKDFADMGFSELPGTASDRGFSENALPDLNFSPTGQSRKAQAGSRAGLNLRLDD